MSAGIAFARGDNESVDQTNRAENVCSHSRVKADADAIPSAMCRRCGFPGPHATAAACITALRDRIATLEFKHAQGRQLHQRRRAAGGTEQGG